MVFGALLLDALGFPIPGELALIAGGYWASLGKVGLAGTIVAGSLGAALGDNLLFLFGRRIGGGKAERLVRLYCQWTACALGSTHCAARAGHLIGRFRARGLLVAKFALLLRTFVALLAGMARIPYRRFVLCDATGALLWCASFTLLGFFLGAQREAIVRSVHRFNLVAGLVALLGAALIVGLKVYRRFRYGAPPGPTRASE